MACLGNHKRPALSGWAHLETTTIAKWPLVGVSRCALLGLPGVTIKVSSQVWRKRQKTAAVQDAAALFRHGIIPRGPGLRLRPDRILRMVLWRLIRDNE